MGSLHIAYSESAAIRTRCYGRCCGSAAGRVSGAAASPVLVPVSSISVVRARLFQVDAFTTRRFAGNPAAVMLMEAFPADSVLQAVAAENNLSETAFIAPDGDDYQIRWFTPVTEVPLCGHATLASAAVVMERLQPGRKAVVFHTKSGPLTVSRKGAGYLMDFPSRPSEPIVTPAGLSEALGV